MDDAFAGIMREIMEPLSNCACSFPETAENGPLLWYATYLARAEPHNGAGFQWGIDGKLLLFLTTRVFTHGSTVADVGAGAGTYAALLNATKEFVPYAFDGDAGTARFTGGTVREQSCASTCPCPEASAASTGLFAWTLRSMSRRQQHPPSHRTYVAWRGEASYVLGRPRLDRRTQTL